MKSAKVVAKLRIVDRRRGSFYDRRILRRSIAVGEVRDQLIPFEFDVSGRPAIYRVDLSFYDTHGKQLGKYGKYFRVMPRRNGVRLTLTQRYLRPGSQLVIRIANVGTTLVNYGESFAIDRFQEGGWVIDPITPSGFIGVGYALGAGSMETCRVIRLPQDLEPGHYRYRKEFHFLNRKNRELFVDFHVRPGIAPQGQANA